MRPGVFRRQSQVHLTSAPRSSRFVVAVERSRRTPQLIPPTSSWPLLRPRDLRSEAHRGGRALGDPTANQEVMDSPSSQSERGEPLEV